MGAEESNLQAGEAVMDDIDGQRTWSHLTGKDHKIIKTMLKEGHL